MNCAKKWISEGINWNSVVFTDEKRFSHDGPDNQISYQENVNNSLQSLSGPYRIKRQMKGGGVMIWGMLLPDGYIHLERLDGRIDSRKYIKMMKKEKPFIEQRMNGKDYLFQQDNCSVHKSKLSMEWLENNNIDVISWPA